MPADPVRSGRLGRLTGVLLRGSVEIAPALLVALVLLPWIISGGRAWPWQPAMIDLDVYIAAVDDLVAGGDIYLTRTPGWDLPFIYPPVAALLFLPLAVLPLWASQLLWALLTVLAQRLILARAGVRRGATLAVLNVVLVVAFEPFRTTLGYGQVNTLLMALVVADLLPRTGSGQGRAGRRLLPRGFLIGLAAAVKLTPLAFLVFAALAGRWRTALVGVLSFLSLTAVGVLILPAESLTFLHKVLAGDLYGDPGYVGNQSVAAVFTRLAGTADSVVRAGLVVSAVVAAAAVLAAVRWWRRGETVLAVGLVGLATCLASPLSWTHHHVWAVLVCLALLAGGQPVLARGLGLAWTAWVALCPMLAFLPYAGGAEQAYTPGQSVVANLGPLLGVILVVVLLIASCRPWLVPAGDRPSTRKDASCPHFVPAPPPTAGTWRGRVPSGGPPGWATTTSASRSSRSPTPTPSSCRGTSI